MNYQEAKEYLLKTIEHNFYDIEAYKLLVKISLKDGAVDDILEASTRLFPPGAAHISRIFSALSRGKIWAVKKLA